MVCVGRRREVAVLEGMCAGVVVGAGLAPWLPAVRLGPLLAAGLAGAVGLAWSDARGLAGWTVLGLVLGWAFATGQAAGPELDGPISVQGVVVGGGMGPNADLACSRWAPSGGEWRPCSGRVRLRFPEASPGPGVALVAQGLATEVGRYPVLPGSPDPVWSARRGRVSTRLRVRRWTRIGRGVRRDCSIDEPTGVLCAVSTGIRTGLDEEIVEVLRDTGTAHVLAISGFHVGVVGGLVGALVFGVLRWIALVRPIGVGPAWAWLAGAAASVGYAWVAGAPTSARRAAGMVVGMVLVRLLGGEIRPLRLLGLAAVGLVLVEPSAVGSAAFHLSFGALLGIVRVGPRLQRWIPPDLPRPVDAVLNAVAVSTAATVGTLPASAWWFQQLPPGSVLANLIALPWCSVAVVPLAAVAAAAPQPIAGWATTLGSASVWALVAVLEPLAVEPWAPAVGPFGALALLCWVVWPARVGRCVLVSWLALGLRCTPIDRVAFLDVGQGDAALARIGGRTWLVDGGPPSERVLQYLRRQGIGRVDVVVATHEQADHTGGLVPVLEQLDVGEVWVSEEGETAALARELGIPVVVRHPAVMHPALDFVADDPNDLSLVFELGGVLFTGDIERLGEQMTWAMLDGSVPVLKVPHHGSKSSSSELLLGAVRPTVAVIGVGATNRYGHPHPTVLERYRERGVAVYRTDQDGTIEVWVRDGWVHVRTWKAGRGWSEVARHRIRP